MINPAGNIDPSIAKAAAFVKPVAPAASGPAEVKNVPVKETAQATQAPDQVTLSPKAREVQKLAALASAAPEVRAEQVAQAVKQAAQENAQTILPGKMAAQVAEKLLMEN